jgi:phage/plasmid-like protein (TIGR03299 family)
LDNQQLEGETQERGNIMDLFNLLSKPTNDYMPFEKLLEEHGMAFEVEKRALSYYRKIGKTPTAVKLPTHRAVVRTDSQDCLGVVQERYGLLPYPLAFAPVEYLINSRKVTYLAGGAPDKGQRAYIAMKAEGEIAMGPKKAIDNVVFVTSSHDGTGQIGGYISPVFDGTVMIPFKDPIFSFKHGAKVDERVVAAAENANEQIAFAWEQFHGGFDRLSKKKVTVDEAVTFAKRMLGEKDHKRTLGRRGKLLEIFNSYELPALKDTLFGLVFASMDFVDHARGTRETVKDAVSVRLTTGLLGSGAAMKIKAWNLGMSLVKG